MGRELRRLHENTLDLHDKMIMQIQVLKTDTITVSRFFFKFKKRGVIWSLFLPKTWFRFFGNTIE